MGLRNVAPLLESLGLGVNEMNIENYAFWYDCSFVIENKTTKLTIKEDIYELPFIIPVQSTKGCILFDKVSNYVLTKTVERTRVIKEVGSFRLYFIELYKKEFDDAMDEFKEVVALCSSKLMKDVIIKAFFNLIDISEKSYDKVYSYVNYDGYCGSLGTFKQYCGLE